MVDPYPGLILKNLAYHLLPGPQGIVAFLKGICTHSNYDLIKQAQSPV